MSKQTFQLGDIFTYDDKYGERVDFCNENNLMIAEITKKGDSVRHFQIQETPTPTEEELRIQRICELKEEIKKAKEDVEQVELFGMTRNDYDAKKTRCVEIILELRELER